MAPAENPLTDYWTTGAAFDAMPAHTFTGRHGLEQLSGMMRLSAHIPTAFAARLSRVQLDHVALQSFAATAHRAERTGSDIDADPTPLLTTCLVLEGAITVRTAKSKFSARAGDVLVIDSDTPMVYEAPGRVRSLQCVTGIEHLPHPLRAAGTFIPAALPRTKLNDSFFRLLSHLLASPSSLGALGVPGVLSALLDLQAAVLAEAQGTVISPSQRTLRQQMEDYIELHLRSPSLRPEEVADAVGISLRRAHIIFSDGPHTLAREIRERRLAAIALELSSSRGRIRAGDLATRYGLSGPDVLRRLFRLRYGLSLQEYRAAHRRAGP